MAITESILWERLSQSGLLAPAAANSLRKQFHSANKPATPGQTSDIVDWLAKGGLISKFHGKLLLGGFAGSFAFGEYTLLDCRPHLAGLPTFAARHTPTRHEVQLVFIAGCEPNDLLTWQGIEERVNALRECMSPNLMRLYESVELPEYRMVVIEASNGRSIDERLGRKGRIPWTVACNLVAQLARAVEEIHSCGMVHGNINGREIFLETNGAPRTAPPIWPTRIEYGPPDRKSTSDYWPTDATSKSITPAVDIYALGVLLYRAVRGETPVEFLKRQSDSINNISAAVAKLEKYEVPKELQNFLGHAMATKAADRLATIRDFCEQLSLVPQWKATRPPAAVAAKSATDYAQWLGRWRPKILTTTATLDDSKSSEIPNSKDVHQALSTFKLVVAEGGFRNRKRKKDRTNWIIWITSAAALIASLFAISKAIQRSPQITDDGRSNTSLNTAQAVPQQEAAKTNQFNVATPTSKINWIQRLVDDNGNIPWQSPTSGSSIDFRLLPPGAAVIVVVRPNELVAQPEASRVAQALGDEFQSFISELETKLAVPIETIEQLIVGFYPTEQQTYESFHIVRLAEPLDKADLVMQWTNAGYLLVPEHPHSWSNDRRAFGISENQAPDTSISEFVYGSRELVGVSLQVTTNNPLSGALAQLVAGTDRDRHLTILALKAGLANEMGKRLLPTRYSLLQQQIPLLIEEQVRAIAFSFHLDNGTYVELSFDHTSDIKSNALRDAVAAKLKSCRDQVTTYVASLPADPHWEKVRQRVDNMLIDLTQHLRFGVEHDQVLVNVWLPPMAAHNLMAVTELALSLKPGADVAVRSDPTTKLATPSSIHQLLQIPRTVQNENPPDLNILIDSLQSDLRDDFPTLPFAFEIRLSNIDLSTAGITRNQRLASLALIDQSLAQVLTQICFQANPDKNASGPEDPRCKLIWVVTRDEAKNTDLILITTRDAAAKNGWNIPVNFNPASK